MKRARLFADGPLPTIPVVDRGEALPTTPVVDRWFGSVVCTSWVWAGTDHPLARSVSGNETWDVRYVAFCSTSGKGGWRRHRWRGRCDPRPGTGTGTVDNTAYLPIDTGWPSLPRVDAVRISSTQARQAADSLR